MIETWLNEIYQLDLDDKTDAAIDVLFDHVDDLLSAGEFDQCDEVLKDLDPNRLSNALIVAVLSITKAAGGHLPSRFHFAERSRASLSQRIGPLRIEALLANL